ncbi:Crp/Fnr family transcriptional regulator [Mycolicibacterium celeriflavum]|uniref:Crp/Fnr family transcriptional regulator n=1 Tax=Mycolicibacterium celeriflavum TaxID=1249101 RepID=UPI003CF34FB8
MVAGAMAEKVPERDSEAVLARSTIMRGLEPADRAALARRFSYARFTPGQCIYHEGQRDPLLYIVVDGKVKIGWRSADLPEKLLAVLGPAEVFGAESMFDSGPRTKSATALTPVLVAVIDRDALHACIDSSPHITEQLMRLLARNLRRAEDLITDLNFTDVPGRIAKQLLHLTQRFGIRQDRQLRLDHGLTQAEIAQLVSASRESVNKALSEFVNRGWITVTGKSLVIHQAELLARRAR